MDLVFTHPTEIYSLRPCRSSDAAYLVAIGGEHSVEIIPVKIQSYVPQLSPDL